MVDGPPPIVGDQQIPEHVDDALRVVGDHWVSWLMALHPLFGISGSLSVLMTLYELMGIIWVSWLMPLHPLLGINGSPSVLTALYELLEVIGSYG